MKKLIIFCLSLFLILFSFNCEEDTVTSSDEKVTTATAELSNVVSNMAQNSTNMSVSEIPEYTDVSKAHNLFQKAIDQDSTNRDAHLGLALTNIIMITQTERMDSLLTIWSEFMSSQNGDSLAKKSEINKSLSLSLTSNSINQQFIDAYTNIPKKAYQNPPKMSEVQNMIENELIPRVETSLKHLNKVLKDQDYRFMIPSEQLNRTDIDSLELDLTEVYAFKAGLLSIHGLANITIAYNVDASVKPDLNEMKNLLAQDSDFLTLRMGKQPMQDARNSFLASTTALTNGKDFLLSENDDQRNDLLPKSAFKTELENDIKSAKSYLNDVKNISTDIDSDGTEENVTVDAKQMFENPVEDFKELLPKYSLSIETIAPEDTEMNISDTTDVIMVTWNADSYSNWKFPDPNINGFLPNMTDSKLKGLLGVSESTWKKQVPIFLDLNYQQLQ